MRVRRIATRARHIIAGILVISAVAACRHAIDLTNPGTVASELRGTWKQPTSFPGISYGFTLAVTDTTVTGTGTFSIEAGASGTLFVNGVLNGTQVALTIVSSIGQRQHFVGSLEDVNTLAGSLWTESTYGSDPVFVTFVRASH